MYNMHALSSRLCKGIRSVVHCGQTVQQQAHTSNFKSTWVNNDSSSASIAASDDEKDYGHDHERKNRTTNSDGYFPGGLNNVMRLGVLAGAAWQLGHVVYKAHDNAKKSNNKHQCLWSHSASHLSHKSVSNGMIALHMLPKSDVSVNSDSSSSDDFSSLLSSSSSLSSSITSGSRDSYSSSELGSEGEQVQSDCVENVNTLEEWAEATAQLCQQEACRQLTQQGIAASSQGHDRLARVLWRQAAAAGHLPAMFNLGLAAARLRQEKRAERWYRRASAAGHGVAAYNLALLVNAHTSSAAENDVEVRCLLEKAAASGVIQAQELLNSLALSSDVGRSAEDVDVALKKENDTEASLSDQLSLITKDVHIRPLRTSRSVPVMLNTCSVSQQITLNDALNVSPDRRNIIPTNVKFEVGDVSDDALDTKISSGSFLRRNYSFGTRDELLMKNIR